MTERTTPTAETDTETMKDVSHTPPAGETVTNVWQRGRTPADVANTDAPAPADD